MPYPYDLRSGVSTNTTPASPGPRIMAVHTQTEDGSDFETFVRKGIADIRSLLGGFEEALEFQSSRTTALEQKVQQLEDKIRNLETKMNSTEHRLQQD